MGPICARISGYAARVPQNAAPYPIRSPPWPSPSSPIPPPISLRRSSTSSTYISFRSTFMVDGEEHHSYLKGQKTDLKQFYTMMREGKVITTSLPNLKDSRELLKGLLVLGPGCALHRVLQRAFRHLPGHRPSAGRAGRRLPGPHGARGGHPGRLHGRRAARLVRRQDARGGCVHHARFATGWRPTSCIWPTGSPWTTSCSCSAAAASPARAPGPAPF